MKECGDVCWLQDADLDSPESHGEGGEAATPSGHSWVFSDQ